MLQRTLFCLCLLCGTASLVFSQKQLTLDAIYRDAVFSGSTLGGITWVPGAAQFSYTKSNGSYQLWLYDMKQKTDFKVLDASDVPEFKRLPREWRITPPNYSWAPDARSILLNSGRDLFHYNLKTKDLKRLTHDDAYERDAMFSPYGKRIAYIKNDNLHVLNLTTGKETALTQNGSDTIRIGRFDWVYQEEFHIRTGFFWSPNSRYIAFYQVDQSNEPVFPLVNYIPTHSDVQEIHYPKAGDPNAIIKIAVVNVEDGSVKWMDVGNETDIYIPRILWLPDSKHLAIYRLNRKQNKLQLLLTDIASGQSKTLVEEHENNGWIDIRDDIQFLKNADEFIWSSDRSGYTHLYLYKLDGTLLCQLTSGDWDVTELNYVDEKHETVYFTGTKASILERHLYSVHLDGKKLHQLTKGAGTHAIKMHSDGVYYIDTFSNATMPSQQRLCRENGKLEAMLSDSDLPAYDEYEIPRPEFFTFKTPDSTSLNASMLKPVDFDPTKKYPVLFSVYGGPGSQTVVNRWSRNNPWNWLLTQKGYILFQMDNRGTGYRGNEFMKQIYGQLGQQDVTDMIHGAEYLRTLPFVDPDRIGVWGWSYGGYMTVMCLLKGADYFKTGVAVAPVTDWHNYDTIWTERYMNTPAHNPDGYEKGSAINYAHLLKGNLLLIHGIADDNVHAANTLQLAYKFQELDKQFDMMLYPRKDHSIRKVRHQLYTFMTDYILEHL